MLGDPGRGSKFWEALDRAIGESRKNRGQIVAHQLALCGSTSRLSLPPPPLQLATQRAETQTSTLAKTRSAAYRCSQTLTL